MNGNKPDVEKRLYWRRILGEAATSGISMRQFCRQRRLKETQFYWWRRMLKSGGQERRVERPVERERGIYPATDPQPSPVTQHQLQISRHRSYFLADQGKEEESLRAVLAALEPASPRNRT